MDKSFGFEQIPTSSFFNCLVHLLTLGKTNKLRYKLKIEPLLSEVVKLGCLLLSDLFKSAVINNLYLDSPKDVFTICDNSEDILVENKHKAFIYNDSDEIEDLDLDFDPETNSYCLNGYDYEGEFGDIYFHYNFADSTIEEAEKLLNLHH